MKKILTLLLALSLQSSFSQTATSIQNGPWLSPTTWDCGCIPIMNYSVTINHTVTLNTSMSFTSATSGLNIGTNGALLQDANRDILIAGGTFNNNGKFNARFFYTQTSSGSGMNVGTMTLSAFTNSVEFINNGSIVVDSITNTYSFQNFGYLQADSLLNKTSISTMTPLIINQGVLNIKWSTNYGEIMNEGLMEGIAHTNNNGLFYNSDTLSLSGGLWNTGNFYNHANIGTPYINLGGGFYNYDPNTHKAMFQNDGKVVVLDSWYNTDTVKGNGCFTVQDSSVNSGYMKGTFSFVDNTPLGPIVDYNLGTISSGINTGACTVGIEKYSNETKFSIFPNPTTSTLNINVGSSSEAYRELNMYDVLGKSILKSEIKSQNSTIDVSSLPSGMYYLKIGNTTQKFIKQ